MSMGRFGGTPAPRKDQEYREPPPNVVAPGGAAGIFRGRLIVLYGSGRGVGLFQYNGTPALGNPPILYSVPPGVTEDPYGNTLPETHGGLWSVSGISVSGLYQGTVQTGVETDYTLAAFVAESGLSWVTSGAKSSGDTESILYLSSAVGTGTGWAQLSKNVPLLATDPNSSVGAAETWHQITTGFPAGWSGTLNYQILATGRVAVDAYAIAIASGTTLTHNETIATLPAAYAPTVNPKTLTAWLDVGGAWSAVPLIIHVGGALLYEGATQTLSTAGSIDLNQDFPVDI